MNGYLIGIDGLVFINFIFIFYIIFLEVVLCMNIEGKLKN